MTPETRDIPDWARRDRQADFEWIGENFDVFRTAATDAFEDVGRGAVVVDTTSRPVPDAGNPFGYFSQEQVAEQGDDDTKRMVTQYDPTREFVLVLLKPADRTSTYRVGNALPEPRPAEASEVTPNSAIEPISGSKLEPPELETLMEWEAEGGCEAACPEQCWVEADGVCTHGNPSWLLKLGLI